MVISITERKGTQSVEKIICLKKYMDLKIALFLTQENQDIFFPNFLPISIANPAHILPNYEYINEARAEIGKDFVCFLKEMRIRLFAFQIFFTFIAQISRLFLSSVLSYDCTKQPA